MTFKLYRVNLRGFDRYDTGVVYKSSYVVAENPDAAYKAVRAKLDTLDYGFAADRALDSIELLAEDLDYTEVKTRLFLPGV